MTKSQKKELDILLKYKSTVDYYMNNGFLVVRSLTEQKKKEIEYYTVIGKKGGKTVIYT